MSGTVKLEKPGHIIVFKIVEHFGEIERKKIIELCKRICKDLLGKHYTDDAIVNWIREITGFEERRDFNMTKVVDDKKREDNIFEVRKSRSKYPILVRKPGGIYFVYKNVTVIPETSSKNIWNEVEFYLKSKIKETKLPYNLRLAHTNQIKKEVIEPLMSLIQNEIKSDEIKYIDVATTVNINLFKDLNNNHIPPDLKRPDELLEKINERIRIYKEKYNLLQTKIETIIKDNFPNEKLKVGQYEIFPELISQWICKVCQEEGIDKLLSHTQYLSIEQALLFVGNLNYKLRDVLVYLYEDGKLGNINKRELNKLRDMSMEILAETLHNSEVLDICQDLKRLKCEIKNLKKQLFDVLSELYNYVVLYGACKYICPRY